MRPPQILRCLGVAGTTMINCGRVHGASVRRGPDPGPTGFLKELGNSTWVIGNNVWNLTQGQQYATKLMYKNVDLVGDAVGHYVSYNGAQSDLSWTTAAIASSGPDYVDIRLSAREGDLHWVIYDDLPGAYQYFVNRDLPTLGAFRTLWRLSNTSFTHGRTNIKDDVLPPLSEYVAATKVQDETWEKSDGTFLTKYDWSAFRRDQDFYGVYGDGVGSWYIQPGKDYLNGDHLKQELMIHRESQTGDAVQLNILHGTHYQAHSSDVFPINKTWGPWLWYLNNGSQNDASQRATMESEQWPYEWFNNSAYQARGSLTGTLKLIDGTPASGAAIFLGDDTGAIGGNLSSLDQGRNYYYTTYAADNGSFHIPNIRQGTYALRAWANGGKLSHIHTTFSHPHIRISPGSESTINNLTWSVPDPKGKKQIFQIGAFDRKTTGFNISTGSPPFYKHALLEACPANLTYSVSPAAKLTDWCFAQSKKGTWTIQFPLFSSATAGVDPSRPDARLIIALAGYSANTATITVNSKTIGQIGPLDGSQDTYRGAIVAGEYRFLSYNVSAEDLDFDGENELSFEITNDKLWRGWLWDAIALEWA